MALCCYPDEACSVKILALLFFACSWKKMNLAWPISRHLDCTLGQYTMGIAHKEIDCCSNSIHEPKDAQGSQNCKLEQYVLKCHCFHRLMEDWLLIFITYGFLKPGVIQNSLKRISQLNRRHITTVSSETIFAKGTSLQPITLRCGVIYYIQPT